MYNEFCFLYSSATKIRQMMNINNIDVTRSEAGHPIAEYIVENIEIMLSCIELILMKDALYGSV